VFYLNTPWSRFIHTGLTNWLSAEPLNIPHQRHRERGQRGDSLWILRCRDWSNPTPCRLGIVVHMVFICLRYMLIERSQMELGGANGRVLTILDEGKSSAKVQCSNDLVKLPSTFNWIPQLAFTRPIESVIKFSFADLPQISIPLLKYNRAIATATYISSSLLTSSIRAAKSIHCLRFSAARNQVWSLHMLC